jgi:hypothetical protein
MTEEQQAFPVPPATFSPTGDMAFATEGLTKREWFAGLAMQARLTHSICAFEDPFKVTAEWAFDMADAMIDEMEKKR